MMKKALALMMALAAIGFAWAADTAPVTEQELQQAIVALSPESYDVVLGPVSITADPGTRVRLRAASRVQLGTGIVPEGATLRSGEQILTGVVHNLGPSELTLVSGEGATTTLAVGAVAIIRQDVKTCSVTCSAGYYACCKSQDGSASCKCRTNGTSDEDCTSGGAGSPTCSITLE